MTALRALRAPVEALLTVLLPPRCAICGVALALRPRYGVCAPCLEHVAHNDGVRCALCDLPSNSSPCRSCLAAPPPFARVVAPFVYGGTIAELVTAAKFGAREDLAAAVGHLLADEARVREAVLAAGVVVPVPLGRSRARRRGYNQSAVIARVLARELGARVCHALARTRDTAPQSELPLAARRGNVDAAFAARGTQPDACVLVDDVVTSAETARQAAAALRAAGVREVVVVAAARTALLDDEV